MNHRLSLILRKVAVIAPIVCVTSGCQSVGHRRQYEHQLALAREEGTRASLQAAFPALRLNARPSVMFCCPLIADETYVLDDRYLLIAAFVHAEPNYDGSEFAPRHSPRDTLVGAAIRKRSR